jgi:alpha-beta hydrolase superfamily lysophospholipase
LTHGIFKNRGQVLSRAEFLVKAGYQVLLFDQRGEGLSGESPVSGGLIEARDFLGAVQYLKANHRLTKPLVFMGFSLGAISALRAATQSTDVDAVIADSPLPNGRSYVAQRTLGGIFTGLPGFLDACLKHYDLLTGLTLTPADLDLATVVPKFNEVPVLYITGEMDDLARSPEVRKLFNLTQTHHRALVYVPGAGHEQTYSAEPQAYEQAVKSFLKEVREHFPEPDQTELLKHAKVLHPAPAKKSVMKEIKQLLSNN